MKFHFLQECMLWDTQLWVRLLFSNLIFQFRDTRISIGFQNCCACTKNPVNTSRENFPFKIVKNKNKLKVILVLKPSLICLSSSYRLFRSQVIGASTSLSQLRLRSANFKFAQPTSNSLGQLRLCSGTTKFSQPISN